MLLKPHLSWHSRMSGSRRVITPSWLSGSLRSFLYSSSVYSCHLFLISSVSVRSLPFPIIYFRFSFIFHIFFTTFLILCCLGFVPVFAVLYYHIYLAYPFIISSFASVLNYIFQFFSSLPCELSRFTLNVINITTGCFFIFYI